MCFSVIAILQCKDTKIPPYHQRYGGNFFMLVFLVDGVLKFQTLVDYFGSYAFVEISLLLLVILPTWAVYKFTKE